MVAYRCSEVTLDEFFDCLAHNNLLRLARYGNPTQKQLDEAWEALYGEFNRLTSSDDGVQRYILRLTKRVSSLEARIRCAAMLITLGREEANSLLSALGYSGGAAGAEEKMRLDMVRLEDTRRELEEAQKGASTIGEGSAEERFTRWISYVGKYMGFHIDKKKVSVLEFIEMDRMMRDEAREAKRMATKKT
jgi:hypothetical protein